MFSSRRVYVLKLLHIQAGSLKKAVVETNKPKESIIAQLRRT